MRLILSSIHSVFQQEVYIKNNALSWKSADTAKINSNFETKSRILITISFRQSHKIS